MMLARLALSILGGLWLLITNNRIFMYYTNISEGFLDKKLFVTNKNLFFSNGSDISQFNNTRIERVIIQTFSRKIFIGLNTNPEVMIKQNDTPITKIKY